MTIKILDRVQGSFLSHKIPNKESFEAMTFLAVYNTEWLGLG